jgi:hypothetical protein
VEGLQWEALTAAERAALTSLGWTQISLDGYYQARSVTISAA